MVRHSLLLITGRCGALIEEVIGGFTLAERCGGQLALHGAYRRRWRFGSVVLCRLCTRLHRLNGLPRLLKWLSGGGGHSCAGL